jgi:hypothetical protein
MKDHNCCVYLLCEFKLSKKKNLHTGLESKQRGMFPAQSRDERSSDRDHDASYSVGQIEYNSGITKDYKTDEKTLAALTDKFSAGQIKSNMARPRTVITICREWRRRSTIRFFVEIRGLPFSRTYT